MASSSIDVAVGIRRLDGEPRVLAGKLLHPGDIERLRELAEHDSALDVLVLPTSWLAALLDHEVALSSELDEVTGGYCRGCGCSQDRPCEPPCAWVGDGLCSACQHAVLPSDDGDGFVVVDLVSGEPLGGPCDTDESDSCEQEGEVVYICRGDAERKARELNGRELDGDGIEVAR